jgi:hypothetical protein
VYCLASVWASPAWRWTMAFLLDMVESIFCDASDLVRVGLGGILGAVCRGWGELPTDELLLRIVGGALDAFYGDEKEREKEGYEHWQGAMSAEIEEGDVMMGDSTTPGVLEEVVLAGEGGEMVKEEEGGRVMGEVVEREEGSEIVGGQEETRDCLEGEGGEMIWGGVVEGDKGVEVMGGIVGGGEGEGVSEETLEDVAVAAEDEQVM